MNEMSCGTARRLAWGDADRVVMSVERARAFAHIARCALCRRFDEDMEALRQALGEGLAPVPASEELRRRVRALIAREQRRRPRLHGALRGGLALAAAIALLSLGLRLVLPRLTDPLRSIVNQESRLLAEPGLESSDPNAVRTWLANRLPFPVHVPTFTDARLTGAAVSRIRGGLSGVVRFEVGDRHITYLIVPDGSPVEMPRAEPEFHQSRYGTLAVVSWRMPGLLHAWVGPIPPELLASLAHRCADQARAAARLGVVIRVTPFTA